MLNDTFYTVFKNLDKYDLKFPFDPWLRKVCVNCCIQYQRKYFKYPETLELANEDFNKAKEEIEWPHHSQIDYMSILEKLPMAYRTVLTLYAIEGYKHHEIAEKLNISIGTSKSNYHRAKKCFMSELSNLNSKTDKKGKANG